MKIYFKKKQYFRLIRRIFYYLLPIILLYFIFQRIDFIELKSNLLKTNLFLLFLSVSLGPLTTAIGCVRWYVLLTQYHGKKPGFWYLLRNYWIGMVLGYFTPGSLGWDGYRVIVSGRVYGRHAFNVIIILAEKMIAFITCASIIVLLSPFLPNLSSPTIRRIISVFSVALGLVIFFVLFLNFFLRSSIFTSLLSRFESFFSKRIGPLYVRLKLGQTGFTPYFSIKALMKPFTQADALFYGFALSTAIPVLGAVSAHFFFLTVGYHLPIIVNLFVSPLLMFIFLLPISFGSLGIREGSYILIYGLFGVPAEVALLVSFYTLFGILLNNALGALILLASAKKDKDLIKSSAKEAKSN